MNNITLSSNSIPNEDLDKLADWIRTYPRLSSGPVVKEFEEKLAAKVGSKYSVFVNSGSSANLLMLYALKVAGRMKNNKVVVPSIAWSTTLTPVMQLGMQPILCDCNLKDLSVDLVELEKIFRETQPACLMLVSVLGMSPDYITIIELCRRHGVILLEDACESLGSKFGVSFVGTIGEMGSYSFFYSHQLCTVEGGAVVTDDEETYQMLLMLREHGWTRKCSPEKNLELKDEWEVDDFNDMYTFYVPGFNFRNTEIAAFLGLMQLERFDQLTMARHNNYVAYNERIYNKFWMPRPVDDSRVANLGYPIISPERDALVKAFKAEGIECRPLISGNMGSQPMYVKDYGKKILRNASIVDSFGMYVPNHAELTIEDIDRIAGITNSLI